MDRQETTDGRLVRGARSRGRIARRAADLASLHGLDGLSIGTLATDLGLSKSSVQTLFGTKETLQLAAADAAATAFREAVVGPARSAAPGVARLRVLVERWIDYARAPLFPGGCFWTANLAAFDSRPGPVRDLLFEQHRGWLAVLTAELRAAVDAGEIPDRDVELAAFQTDAVLTAANIALRVGDAGGVGKARRVIDGILAP